MMGLQVPVPSVASKVMVTASLAVGKAGSAVMSWAESDSGARANSKEAAQRPRNFENA